MNNRITFEKIGYYDSRKVYSGERSPERTVEFYELELYTKGTGTSFIDGKAHVQSVGNILFAKPGQVRYSILPFECYYIHFSGADDIAEALSTLPSVFSFCEPHKISDIIEDMMSADRAQKPGNIFYLTGKLYELVSLILSEDSAAYKGKYVFYRKTIYDVRQKIDSLYSEKLTLGMLAESAHLSPGFLHNVFKDIVGVTPAQYITAVRIRSAKKLLEDSDMTVSEISSSVGYDSQAYFSAVFKKSTGITPLAYRHEKHKEILL